MVTLCRLIINSLIYPCYSSRILHGVIPQARYGKRSPTILRVYIKYEVIILSGIEVCLERHLPALVGLLRQDSTQVRRHGIKQHIAIRWRITHPIRQADIQRTTPQGDRVVDVRQEHHISCRHTLCCLRVELKVMRQHDAIDILLELGLTFGTVSHTLLVRHRVHLLVIGPAFGRRLHRVLNGRSCRFGRCSHRGRCGCFSR